MKKHSFFALISSALILFNSCGVITKTRYGNGLKLNLWECKAAPDARSTMLVQTESKKKTPFKKRPVEIKLSDTLLKTINSKTAIVALQKAIINSCANKKFHKTTFIGNPKLTHILLINRLKSVQTDGKQTPSDGKKSIKVGLILFFLGLVIFILAWIAFSNLTTSLIDVFFAFFIYATAILAGLIVLTGIALLIIGLINRSRFRKPGLKVQ